MRTIVVGCGEMGAALAYQLFRQGHLVTVIDQDAAAFDHLPSDFQGQIIEGDVLAKNVLQRAQIHEAEAIAVVTTSDALNALVAYIARTEYKIPRVVAANTDPRQRPIQEAFGVPVIGSVGWGAQQFVELLVDTPLREIHVVGDPNFVVCQIRVPQNWLGGRVTDFLPVEQFTILSLTRAGKSLPGSALKSFVQGDLVYLQAAPAAIEILRSKLR